MQMINEPTYNSRVGVLFGRECEKSLYFLDLKLSIFVLGLISKEGIVVFKRGGWCV